MKSSDPFKIDQAWWKKNKPTTLKSTGLGEAMKAYLDLKKKCEDAAIDGLYKTIKGEVLPFGPAKDALKTLKTTAAEALNACNKTLHKDAIAVLGKAPAVLKDEKEELTQFEQTHTRKYATYVNARTSKLNKEVVQAEQWKGEAQIQHKKADAANQRLTTLAQKTLAAHKGGTLSNEEAERAADESRDLLVEVIDAVQEIERLYESAKELDTNVEIGDQNAVTAADWRAFNGLNDKVRSNYNMISTYHSKAQMWMAEAKGNTIDLQKAVKGRNANLVEWSTQLGEMAKALKTLADDARRIVNTIIPMVMEAKVMVERPEQMVESGLPADQFKGKADGFVDRAEKLAAKSAKINTQARASVDKLFAKIPAPQLREPRFFAPLVEKIEESMTHIESYEENSAKHVGTLRGYANRL